MNIPCEELVFGVVISFVEHLPKIIRIISVLEQQIVEMVTKCTLFKLLKTLANDINEQINFGCIDTNADYYIEDLFDCMS